MIKWLLLSVSAFLVLATGIGGFLIMNKMHAQAALTFAVIIGVILLLVTVTLVAVAFSLLKMNNNEEALALPKGSVRAIIALSLLVIFVMLTVFLYSDQATNNVHIQTISGLTQEQSDAIPKDLLLGSPLPKGGTPPTFEVKLLLPRNQVSADFSKQIFTAISTMVISIAAFYFGARTVASARAAAVTSVPELTNVDPAKVVFSESPRPVTIYGVGFDNPSVVKFIKDGKELVVLDPTSNPTKIVGTIPALTANDVGHWSCIVVNGDGRAAPPLQNALEVTQLVTSPP